MSPLFIFSAVGGLVIIFVIYILTQKSHGGSRGTSTTSSLSSGNKLTPEDAVLIVGPPQSGKTTFLLKMKHPDKDVPVTFTSQKHNETTLKINSKELNFRDMPGSGRMRQSIRQCLNRGVKAVIFMVDSDTFLSTADTQSLSEEASELLYDVLSIGENVPPVLVLCNKSDVSLVRQNYVKKKLEKELQRLWSVRKPSSSNLSSNPGASLESLDETDKTGNQGLLVLDGDSFSFEKTCRSPQITWMDFTVLKAKETDFEKIKDWIDEYVE